MIKKDKNILDFFLTFKEWELLNEQPEQKLLEEYLNPDFVNLAILHLIPYETFYTGEDQMIETGGANPVTDMYSAYEFVHHLVTAEMKALEKPSKMFETIIGDFEEIEPTDDPLMV